MNHLEAQFNILKQKTQELKSTNSNERAINTKINSLEKKLEDYILKLDSKITLFQSNFRYTSFFLLYLFPHYPHSNSNRI